MGVFLAVVSALMLYKAIYTVIGFLTKPKVFKHTPMTRKYGVVIAARNEENVIGYLIDSLMDQTYVHENYKVFVVADNCTDNTAKIAREHGAFVYERHCPEKARKGWALEFLFEKIEQDFGISSFDGYIFFDADNVISRDYIEQMNNAFATGCDAVIGYRNTKNFDHNCISANYGIHFLRSSMILHRPRSRFGFCTHIAGTGYLLSSDLLKDGWHYSYLTEDTQATMDFAVKGKRIEYCEAAEFFDEQPYQISVMVRQRIRWAKGRLACFFTFGHRLVLGVFKRFPKENNLIIEQTKKRDDTQKKKEKNISFVEKILDFVTNITSFFEQKFKPISKNFSCYDMFFYLFPNSMMLLVADLVQYIASVIAIAQVSQMTFKIASEWIVLLLGILFGSVLSYLGSMGLGLLVIIREWKHIHCSKGKIIFSLITLPIFDRLYGFLCIISLFMRVKWKPIKHDEAISIKDIKK